jgi:cell division protein FtsZ
MLFITAGMGGGTGTGAAPIVAEVAKELGILTVAVVTKPFNFEGKKRRAIADRGILELSNHVDSLITIPNEKLLTVLGKDITMEDAFTSANDILLGAVQGIAEIITCPGLINVDFADVKTVMSEMGLAMMGSGLSQGTERAREAAESAISSPLLEDINITGARGILVNVTAGPSLGIGEIAEIGDHIEELAAEDATVVVGTVIDESMGDDLRVTLVATGIGEENVVTPQTVPESQPAVTDININRPRPESAQTTATANADSNAEIDNGRYDEALLDVPAFLRRQAD